MRLEAPHHESFGGRLHGMGLAQEGVVEGVSEVGEHRNRHLCRRDLPVLGPIPGPFRIGADVFAQAAEDLRRVVGGKAGLERGEELGPLGHSRGSGSPRAVMEGVRRNDKHARHSSLQRGEDLLHAWGGLVEILDEDVLKPGESALLVPGIGEEGAREEFELQGEVQEAVLEHTGDVEVQASLDPIEKLQLMGRARMAVAEAIGEALGQSRDRNLAGFGIPQRGPVLDAARKRVEKLYVLEEKGRARELEAALRAVVPREVDHQVLGEVDADGTRLGVPHAGRGEAPVPQALLDERPPGREFLADPRGRRVDKLRARGAAERRPCSRPASRRLDMAFLFALEKRCPARARGALQQDENGVAGHSGVEQEVESFPQRMFQALPREPGEDFSVMELGSGR
ncbi:hypothetical protein D3C87_1061590 [compost metagenome]